MNKAMQEKWGGVKFISEYLGEFNAWVVIGIHSLKKKRSAGGLRMKSYNSYDQAVEDVFKLSKAMTQKFKLADMEWGGAKSIIFQKSKLSASKRKKLLLEFGRIVNSLNGEYYVGPDIGTSSSDMDFLFQNSTKYVFSKAKQNGGAGDSSFPTAIGVIAALKATCQFLNGKNSLKNIRINIQGIGGVGKHLIELLSKEKAIIAFNEVQNDTIDYYKSKGFQFLDNEEIYTKECDIFCPCGPGGIINKNTIGLFNCRAIVGAANNQLSDPQIAADLKYNNILYAPDFLVNLGGAMGITLIEAENVSPENSFRRVEKTIASKLLEVYKKSHKENCTTLEAVHQI